MEMINHIYVDTDGIPRTINKHVKVNMIEVKYSHGESADDIATHYGITLADVYGALSYFHDHRDYFEARRRQAEPYIEQAKQYSSDLKAKIQARLDTIQDE